MTIDRWLVLLEINGINKSKFISNPIHAPIQVEEDTLIRDPHISVKISVKKRNDRDYTDH